VNRRAPVADPGSFRDPRNRVFVADNAVYRALDTTAADEVRAVLGSPFFDAARRRDAVVATEWCPVPPMEDDAQHWAAWLRHDRIPVISYPYEWTFSMLRDAALLQLRLLADALADGFVCKDATPYNVQFVGSHPTFIDIGSFEAYRPGDPWFGYRQFCQLYLYPLLLTAYRDLPFHPWLRGAVDGITPLEAQRLLGGWKRNWKGLATHVWLHARLERRLADSQDDVQQRVRSAGFSKKLIEANVSKLTRLIEGLSWGPDASEWSEYSDRAHYTDHALAAKEHFVSQVAADAAAHHVWDVGANDGRFSHLVARHADHVLAIDADHLVVDQLYRRLRDAGDRRILPLMVNLADPSPATGWQATERQPLWVRSQPDLVVYLAVVHHLAITHHVPLPAFLDAAAERSPRLVIEFPDRNDPMVQRLLAGKQEGLHADYDLENFEALVAERFEVVARESLPGGTRTLFDLRRR
jgi:hypothetical protein